jgi:hypothetical protein
MAIRSFLHRGGLTGEQRVDAQEYLRAVRPLTETLDREYAAWLEVGAEGSQLSRDRDPDGQHASVYLWRVGDTARDFVQRDPVKGAERYHEALSLCLEARAAAADLFKESAGTGTHSNPHAKVATANRKLADAERFYAQSVEALRELERQLAAK